MDVGTKEASSTDYDLSLSRGPGLGWTDRVGLDEAIGILRREVWRWKVPAVGHYRQSPFTVLIACVLSLRTQDRTTHAAAGRLFDLATTPLEMIRLSPRRVEKAIYPVGFYRTKARNILRICRQILSDFGGKVPRTIGELLELPGVGRKTANLVVTLGYDLDGICVDTHVHRITNRWGYVRTKSPDDTEMALRKKLPLRYWKILNDLLVTYGQNLCTPISPWCSRCKVAAFCRKVGVTTSR